MLDKSLSFDSDTSHTAIGVAEEAASPFNEADEEATHEDGDELSVTLEGRKMGRGDFDAKKIE